MSVATMAPAINTGADNFQPSADEKKALAAKLRDQTCACRVHHEKLGVRKSLTREQVGKAAASFSADGKALSAAKKLIDTTDPTYRSVANVRSRANAYWKASTVPYPEPGTRLLRRQNVAAFEAKMQEFSAELHEAAEALQAKYAELRERAKEQLGDLFDETDYPERVDTEFALDWDYPSIEPPAYLKNLHPQLYEQECERIRARFEEAVRLTEQAFATKFHELIAHLAERLSGGVDGKPKVFRDSAVENLKAFFGEFKNLDLGSSGELQKLVDQAQKVVEGVNPDDLRSVGDTRNKVADELAKVAAAVDGLMIEKPNRAITFEDEAGSEAA
jgi:hypothetical protein